MWRYLFDFILQTFQLSNHSVYAINILFNKFLFVEYFGSSVSARLYYHNKTTNIFLPALYPVLNYDATLIFLDNICGMFIKNTNDLMLLAKKEETLQVIIDRLVETGKNCGMETT